MDHVDVERGRITEGPYRLSGHTLDASVEDGGPSKEMVIRDTVSGSKEA